VAKCVASNGAILRVSDREAERLVSQGAKYVSKSVWKQARKEQAKP
jgi:hypothetical protein